VIIPVRWHGRIKFPGTDVNSSRVRFQYGTVVQAYAFSFTALFVLPTLDLLLVSLGMLLLPGHIVFAFPPRQGQVAQRKYSFEGNQPGVLLRL
jgi:hypothetical protein